jgi:hypothetical protein
LIKFATALRLGTADAESILRRFTRTWENGCRSLNERAVPERLCRNFGLR